MTTSKPSSKDLDLLLIGKTGNGKSATGNSILRKTAFRSRASSESVTKTADFDYSVFGDRVLKVVDVPGIGDTDLNGKESLQLVINAVERAILSNPEGYHAFLIVVRYGRRFTDEEFQAIEFLKAICGPDVVRRHCVCVLTCGDNFDESDSFADWCSRQEGKFGSLLRECNHRAVLFDNRTKDENKKSLQVQQLIDIIEKSGLARHRYTDNNFKAARAERDKLLVSATEPHIREEVMKEMSLIIEQLARNNTTAPQRRLQLMSELRERAIKLLQKVKDEDQGTGALKSVKETVKGVLQTVDDQASLAKSEISETQLERQYKEDMKKMDEEHQNEIEQIKREFEAMRARNEKQSAELQKRHKELEVGFQEIKKEEQEKQFGFFYVAGKVVRRLLSVVMAVAL